MLVPSPHHRIQLHGRQGQLSFAVETTLTAPWTVLFGPSGSGKSTLLRALGGLLPHLGLVFDRFDAPAGGWTPLAALPPQRRSLSYDPQQALLLPHLTAEQNIRFPERLHRLPAAQSRLGALAELLHLAPLLPKMPHRLSGGERQRVALARALAVPNPRLLLLDEPFAGLDRAQRDHLVPRLQAHLAARALPVLSVTHDPDEALLLDAEVLRLHEGQLTAQGPARQVLADEIARLTHLITAAPLPSLA